MKIFIDETGIFKVTSGSSPSISGVGALVIPDSSSKKIYSRYEKIRRNLPKSKGEVKGKLLLEKDIFEVVEILRRNDALFEINLIDMNLENETFIEEHRNGQIKGLAENVGQEHHENVHKAIANLQEVLRKMPSQLYVQSVISSDLLHRVFSHAPTYYAQRQPKELANFEWIIDAKDKNRITLWEDWWKKVVMPFLQSNSLREPSFRLKGADYSFMDKHEIPRPDWLPAAKDDGREYSTMLLNDIFSKFRFVSSPEYGLEMVDILTNAVRRACVGNLKIEGWKDISKLIISKKDTNRARLLKLGPVNPKQKLPYSKVIKKLDEQGRSMLTSNKLKQTLKR